MPAYVTAFAIVPLPTAMLTVTFEDPTVIATLQREELRAPPPLSRLAKEL